MVISLEEVKKIVQNLGERDLHNPEGAGVDLRLGAVYKTSGGQAFIEADTADGQGRRSMFETEELMRFDPSRNEQPTLQINPGDYFLVKTVEAVNIPIDILADFRPRSTLFRSGLQMQTGFGPPGYTGELIFGLSNLGDFTVNLQMGARICHVVFYRLESPGTAYRGQNQGGRVTASGVEQQV